jgi:serine/threonine protein kinase
MTTLGPDDLAWIDEVVDRFESAWRRGETPRIEDHLVGIGEGPRRDELLKQLVAVELELRGKDRGTLKLEDDDLHLPGHARTIRETFQPAIERTETSATGSPSHANEPPSGLPAVPGYQVLGVIGKGAMGIVYQARHLGLSKPVAIKLILPGASLERFNREARLIAQISSPHVVSVYDFRVQSDGQALLIMEYVDGTDLLGAMRERGGVLPEDQAVQWMKHVCEGMMAAAEHGIIYRDLKPANILIDRKGRARVADFGLARTER